MDNDGEFFAGFGPDTLSGRVGREEFGMLGLERLEPAHQGIVLGVGQLGGVEDVVEVVVTVYLLAQLLDFRPPALDILRHRGSVYPSRRKKVAWFERLLSRAARLHR